MDDYTRYDFCLTIEQIKEALESGQEITVIINGMYYTVKEEAK